MKCVWAAPYVITGDRGRIEIHTNGQAHTIDVQLDRIAQLPSIEHSINNSIVKNGTFIKFGWPQIASSLISEGSDDFYFDAEQLLRWYTAFNPHGTFKLNANKELTNFEATGIEFKKWLPSELTSPHWYNLERFCSLIGAYLAKERNGGKVRTVREFVAEFRGLSGSAKLKAVTDDAHLTNCLLSDLIVKGEICRNKADFLLYVMKEHSRPVKPAQLGAIGDEHIRNFLIEHHLVGDLDLIEYRKIEGESEGLPFILEAAFGMYSERWRDCERDEIIGLNWTPALRAPFEELPRLLGDARVNDHDPVAVVVHVASPRFTFTDRGKSALVLSDEMHEALEKCIKSVTKKWTALKREADKQNRLSRKALEYYEQQSKAKMLSVKAAVYRVMKQAYLIASANGTLPANARQIMYAARPFVIELTGKTKPWKKSSYFTQTLLIHYMKDNPEGTESWDVVFDARGHLIEPHTGYKVDLGTVQVRQYVQSWHLGAYSEEEITLSRSFSTRGPDNRYRFALFVEKEGFSHLWEAVRLVERFDLAIMSTKGMSVTTSRKLVEKLSEKDVTILVLHDFDKSGFSILNTLKSNTPRYQYAKPPNVIDLGVRLDDVKRLGLQSEEVEYDSDPRPNLRENGATDEEIAFLVKRKDGSKWYGERMEINAMPSDVLVAWLEEKLIQAGAAKVVPSDDVLKEAWKQFTRRAKVQDAINKALAEAKRADEPLPDGLADAVREAIDGKTTAWDIALWDIAFKHVTNNKEK